MPRTSLTFVIIAILLTACSLVSPTTPPTFIPSATLTTPIPTPSPTGTASATPTSTDASVQVEVIEENIPAVSTYVFEKIIYPINEDGKYFEEFGINTIDDFRRVIAENNGYLPASGKGNVILVPELEISTSTALEKTGVKMDKPLLTTIDLQFSSDESEPVKSNSIPIHWWGGIDNNMDNNKSVYLRSGIISTGIESVFLIKFHWKDHRFDLFGIKIPSNQKLTPEEVAFQANALTRVFLLAETVFKNPESNELVKSGFDKWVLNLDKQGDVRNIDYPFLFKILILSELYNNSAIMSATPPEMFSSKK